MEVLQRIILLIDALSWGEYFIIMASLFLGCLIIEGYFYFCQELDELCKIPEPEFIREEEK
jgi:hypothetical protein